MGLHGVFFFCSLCRLKCRKGLFVTTNLPSIRSLLRLKLNLQFKKLQHIFEIDYVSCTTLFSGHHGGNVFFDRADGLEVEFFHQHLGHRGR